MTPSMSRKTLSGAAEMTRKETGDKVMVHMSGSLQTLIRLLIFTTQVTGSLDSYKTRKECDQICIFVSLVYPYIKT